MCQRCGDDSCSGRAVVFKVPMVYALTLRYMGEILSDRLLWEALQAWNFPPDQKLAAFRIGRPLFGRVAFQAAMRSFVRSELTK